MIGETQQALVAEYLSGTKYAALSDKYGITYHAVTKVLKDVFGSRPSSAREMYAQERIAEISASAGKVFGLSPGAIWHGTRIQQRTRARYAAWLVCIENGIAAKAIARAYEMDHSSVLHGRDQARILAEKVPEFGDRLNALRAMVAP